MGHIVAVESVDDAAFDDYTNLTDVALRRKQEPERGIFIAESKNVLARALDTGIEPRSVLVSERWLSQVEPMVEQFDIPLYVAHESVLEQITGFHLHRGALAAMQRPELADPADLVAGKQLIVIIDGVVDHTNVGAIFRSVAGLGADAVLVTDRSADPLYRRSVRVSMGTVLQVPWTRIPSLRSAKDALHDAGFTIAGLALTDDAVDLSQFAPEGPVALVLGSEGHGLDRGALAACDAKIVIPMLHGVDSLNVAAASAVATWAMRNSMLEAQNHG